MTGVKQFDRNVVLDRAADLFWRQGYDATSIQDIEAATGLGRGSLYNAFGDKEAMFLTVLARYGETLGSAPIRHLEDADVRRGLRCMLESIVARMDEPGRPRGCLMTNTCANGGSPAVAAQVASGMLGLEVALESAFQRARSEGQIPASTAPRALARFYCAVVQSLGVTHKAFADAATLTDIVDVAMSAWPRRDEPASR